MVAQIDRSYLRARPSKAWSRLLGYLFFEGRPLTTRGQWINSLVFAGFALQRRLPPLRRVDRPVFILGTGRSGTTILGVVLSMHRDVGFLNEPKALWHAVHGGEDLIGSYSGGAAQYRLGAEDATCAIRAAAHRFYGAYLRAAGARRIVDKYPEMIFRVPFLTAIFPDARFIFLSRNGWDTCASVAAWSSRMGWRSGTTVHDWWGADRRKWRLLIDQIVPEHADLAGAAGEMHGWDTTTDMAAVEWIVTMREGLSLLQSRPDDVLHLPYEALVSDPRAAMARITEFAGLGRDQRFFDYAAATLTSAPARAPFPLAPVLQEPFRKTMADLGYRG